MEELEQILRCHACRYPHMEPTDAVKLIYQNEFGGGHLVRDTDAFWAYLHREYEGISKDPTLPRYEEIGNGLVRVHLAALQPQDLENLGQAFLHCAKQHRGSLPRFLEKLEILVRLTKEGIFSFDAATLDAYLTAYAQAGYPMVSHSEAYRRAYRPAYRITAAF